MRRIHRPAQLDRVSVGGLGVLSRPLRKPHAGGADRRRCNGRDEPPFHRVTVRSRKALPITSTELRLIAALAMIGLSRIP